MENRVRRKKLVSISENVVDAACKMKSEKMAHPLDRCSDEVGCEEKLFARVAAITEEINY